MSDNNANNAATNNKVQVSGMEKKGFFAGLKEKKEAFVEKHEKGCKIAATGLKVVGAGLLTLIGFEAGKSVGSHKSSDVPGIDIIESGESFDDASNDAVDNNDN